MDHVKFPSIRGFHNIWKELRVDPVPGLRYTFRGKIKLHGTNAGVRVEVDRTVVAQARNDDRTIQQDNYGWAVYVHKNRDFYANLVLPSKGAPIIVYGEWCGPGIQKNVACSKLDEKYFFIFAIRIGDLMWVDPEDIKDILTFNGDRPLPDCTRIVPWHTVPFEIDFNDRDAGEALAAKFNEMVAEVDACDPYIKREFGIEGVGEGIVFYPYVEGAFLTTHTSNLMFKVKGSSHAEKGEKRARVTPALASGAEEYAAQFVTEARLEQGLREIFGDAPPSVEKMGPFLKWMGNDIIKEGADELAASGLIWKQVAGPIMIRSRNWLFKQIEAATFA